jgi:hypothetical protein
VKRVVFVGNLGSRAVRLARQRAEELDVPFIDLETIYWQPGWKLATFEERQHAIAALIDQESWIVAGYSKRCLAAAEEVHFVRSSKWFCTVNYLWNAVLYLFRSRPGMPAHCPEILGLYANVIRIWRFDKDIGTELLDDISTKRS